MPHKHSFDSKCLDLARYFYPHAADHWLRDLAQQFQDIAESAEDIQSTAPETGNVEGHDANGSPVVNLDDATKQRITKFVKGCRRNAGLPTDPPTATDFGGGIAE